MEKGFQSLEKVEQKSETDLKKEDF